MTRDQAQNFCESIASGAGLAEIPDELTQFVLAGIQDIRNIRNRWWLGATDRDEVSREFIPRDEIILENIIGFRE